MFCTLLSRLLGFIRVAVIGAIFGASGKADVLNTVFQIPNNLRKLLAEGALSSAFIPALSSLIVKDSSLDSAKKLTRNIITFLILILTPLIVLAIVFARPIINVLLPFPEKWKVELSINLFRWLIGYIGLISISSIIMAVLNSHGQFIIPALSPTLFSICVISSILFLYRYMGIYSVAAGVLSGGLAQIIFQSPLYLKKGYDFKLYFKFNSPDFKRTMRSWLPVVLSASIFAVNQQVALYFASGLEDGSTSALANALVFWQLPFGIFSISVITVLFPRMSRQVESHDIGGLRESLTHGIKFIIIMMVPASVIYIFLGKEIIAVALQRYKFSHSGTVMAFHVLQGYSLGLLSVGTFNFFQRFFYSCKDYKTPLYSAMLVSIIDVAFSFWLKETYLRVAGLAVANTIAFTAGLFFQIFFIKKKVLHLKSREIWPTLLKSILTSLILAISIIAFKRFTVSMWTEGSSWVNLILLLIALIISLVIILVVYYYMDIKIVKYYIDNRWKNAKTK
ncbi:MAG: murein biosynthesis integral membrane protein MurJ [Spirochaetales bacterium]|nr:murein biosynthesis integral membrane protein MurJ [Spirochaetales bacterium]